MMDDQDKNWPAWHYGPRGQGKVFNSADEVPAGWKDHPSKVDGAEAPELEKIPGRSTDGASDVDKSGNAWDAEINTADKAQTASGLWKLLPGKSRPAPVTLDL